MASLLSTSIHLEKQEDVKGVAKFDPLHDIMIGYSAGADSSVLYAEMRAKSGNPLNSLVLLGPALESGGISTEEYINKISNLGINVLIVDEIGHREELFKNIKNVTVIDVSPLPHGDLDDSLTIMNSVYNWLDTQSK